MDTEVLPAATVLAILDGMGAIGLDTERVRSTAGVHATLTDPETPVPTALVGAVWQAAFDQAPRATLAIEVGLQIRLGAFGSMDYLAASRDTVGEGFRSLAAQLSTIAPGRGLELAETTAEYRVTLFGGEPPAQRALSDELTIAIVLHHFRAHTNDLLVTRVELTRAVGDAVQFSSLLGAPTTFEHGRSAIVFAPTAPLTPLTSRDPHLVRTLESLSSRLPGVAEGPPFELAIRERLRLLLPEGRAGASEVARSLGLSERSFHRKLASSSRSYQEIVDAFRRGEAEWQLQATDAQLSQVALSLGFADHSAFSRAFKRWTGVSPSEWRRTR